jgi:serine/threonine protein kinase/Tol biopolymer transport system component
MVGRILSHYRILEKLGRGGMGEVYVALDPRLNRRVALKILPPEVAESAEQRKRFEKEARALAALNHPHIVTVHSVEECEGIHFITMELVDGKTLSEVIARQGLPLKSFFELAIPLADALSSAHEHGITHRDLKPTNIMVSDEGRLKVLDFGLAKIRYRAGGSALSELPTQSMTEEGQIVGTVSYMSPEQAKAKPVDHRTDVFSLGIILYEMLTGRHPFLADSVASTLSAILKDTPRSVTELNPEAPRELGRVVRRCLSKEPSRRYQSCLDLRNELEDLKGELTSPAETPAIWSAPHPSGKPMVRAMIAVAIGVVVAVAALTLIGPDFRGAPPKRETTRFSVGPPEGGSFGALSAQPPLAVSPDGRHLTFVASAGDLSDHLWVRSLDSVSARALPGTKGAWAPFWSPDGSQIGYFAEGALRKISISGGPPQTLAEGDNGGTWNREGVILFSGRDGLYRVSSQGDEATPVTRLDPSRREFSHRFPQFLRDGRRFLYLVLSEEPQYRGIYAGSLNSSEKKRVLSENSNAVHAAPGYLFFVRENTLLAQTFDETGLELTGDPVTVAERVMPAPTVRYAPFSISADVLAYREGGWSFSTQLVWMDRKGREMGDVGAAGLNFPQSLSPDETRLATSRWDRTTNTDIWLIDLSRNISERLISDPAFEFWPVWSPDGEQIVFTSSRKGTLDVYRKLVTGLAPEEVVFASPSGDRSYDWSSDGRFVLVESSGDLWVVPMASDRKPFPFLKTKFAEKQPQLSPDGRWLAYTSDESGTREVYVQEFPEAGRRWRVSTRGGLDPRWRRDGLELFYLEPGPPTGTSHMAEPTLMAVSVKVGARFEAAAPQALFRVRVPALWMEEHRTYAVASRGQRFLFNKVIDVEPSLITVVLNWREALPR